MGALGQVGQPLTLGVLTGGEGSGQVLGPSAGERVLADGLSMNYMLATARQ